jgi:DNA-binding CsgD family transcriptional regulator
MKTAKKPVKRGKVVVERSAGVCPCCGQSLRNRVIPAKEPYQMELTPRQAEILRLVAQGKNGTQIADGLGISRRTVEFHKLMLMQRLRITTTAELTLYAASHGYL